VGGRAASCSRRTIPRRTRRIDRSAPWCEYAGWEAHGYYKSSDPGCASPAWIGWGVGDQARYSNDRTDYVAFMLRADNEGDQLGWKKFDGYSLLVHYDWPPNPPSNMSMSAGTSQTPCSADPASPVYLNNAAGLLTLRTDGRPTIPSAPRPSQPAAALCRMSNRPLPDGGDLDYPADRLCPESPICAHPSPADRSRHR